MTSSEVGEKLEQIQSLMREIESGELAEAMEQLRRLMEDADPSEVASMMQDIEMTTEKLMENLDRTIELLQRDVRNASMNEEIVVGLMGELQVPEKLVMGWGDLVLATAGAVARQRVGDCLADRVRILGERCRIEIAL